MREKVRVLVTGVGGGGNGEQFIKTLKMAKTPYYIVGTDISPFSSGLYEVDEGHIVPPATHPDYVAAILELCTKRSLQVLMTGSEPELQVIATHRNLFHQAGILVLMNNGRLIESCLDKHETYSLLKQNGFTVPESYLIGTRDEADSIPDAMFPVIVKPSGSGGGSRHTYIAQDRDELVFFVLYIMKDGLSPFVQEYVGTPDDEYTIGVLHTLDGVFVNSIAVKRNLTSGLSVKLKVRNRTGKEYLSPSLVVSSGYSQGFIDTFPAVTGPCEAVAGALGSEGPLNIQCRFMGGKAYVFEINPRFSGTSSLRAMVDFNEPDILIRHHLLKEPVTPRFSYGKGMIIRGLREMLIPDTEKKKGNS
jgi:carbamoyl-phosphate synthase large subunit